MSDKLKEKELDEVSRILEENGIFIKFSGDYSFCTIKYKDEVVAEMKGRDAIIELGQDTKFIGG